MLFDDNWDTWDFLDDFINFLHEDPLKEDQMI